MLKKIVFISIFVLVLCIPANAVNGLGIISSDIDELVYGTNIIFMGSFLDPGTQTRGNILENLVMQEYLSDTN